MRLSLSPREANLPADTCISVVFPQWIINNLPWKINTILTQIQNDLHKFALNHVKERRAELAKEKPSTSTDPDAPTEGRNDILSLLVRSGDFTDHDLAEQTLTMMAAGHETTSSARKSVEPRGNPL